MIALMVMLSVVSNPKFLDYESGYKEFNKTKRPLIVVVTSKSCVYCGPMKQELLKVQEDYPEFILCEMDYSLVEKHFDFIDLKRGVPQTFMYAYDNERGSITRFKTLIGRTTKDKLYEAWGIPKP